MCHVRFMGKVPTFDVAGIFPLVLLLGVCFLPFFQTNHWDCFFGNGTSNLTWSDDVEKVFALHHLTPEKTVVGWRITCTLYVEGAEIKLEHAATGKLRRLNKQWIPMGSQNREQTKSSPKSNRGFEKTCRPSKKILKSNIHFHTYITSSSNKLLA